jgi:hypothetical protein
MSYVIQLWEQPANLPLPTTVAEADAMLDTLDAKSPGQNPKFIAFAKRITKRFPCVTSPECEDLESYELAWTDGPLDGITQGAVYSIGLSSARLDDVRPFVLYVAQAEGLCVGDDQAGEFYFGYGRNLSVHDEQVAAEALRALPNRPSNRELLEAVASRFSTFLAKHKFVLDTDKVIDEGDHYTERHWIHRGEAGWINFSVQTRELSNPTRCELDVDSAIGFHAASDLKLRIHYDDAVPANHEPICSEFFQLGHWLSEPDRLFVGSDRRFGVRHRDDMASVSAHLLSQIESHLLPIWAHHDSIDNADRLMNALPLSKNPMVRNYLPYADDYILIAYLAGNPRLDEICEEFIALTGPGSQPLGFGSYDFVHKCIAYVRAHPRPARDDPMMFGRQSDKRAQTRAILDQLDNADDLKRR